MDDALKMTAYKNNADYYKMLPMRRGVCGQIAGKQLSLEGLLVLRDVYFSSRETGTDSVQSADSTLCRMFVRWLPLHLTAR